MFALLVLICGYSARKFGGVLPPFVANYAPDALWAMMVFFLIASFRPEWPVGRIGSATLIFAYAIEISQLYQATWINAIRATTVGGLILGRGFLWSDLLCYAVGIGVGVLIEQLCFSIQKKKSNYEIAN